MCLARCGLYWGKRDPNLNIQFEFLISGSGFSYPFLFSYQTWKCLLWGLECSCSPCQVNRFTFQLGPALGTQCVLPARTWPLHFFAATLCGPHCWWPPLSGSQCLRPAAEYGGRSQEVGLLGMVPSQCQTGCGDSGNCHICWPWDDLLTKDPGH